MANEDKKKSKKKQDPEDQTPEWLRGASEFAIDFAHPDAPDTLPQPDNDKVELETMQMFDYVEGNNIVGVIDRRKFLAQSRRGDGNRKPIEVQAQEVEEDVDSKPEPTIEVGSYVLFYDGSIIKAGTLEEISLAVLDLVSEHEDLDNDDVLILQRKPLEEIVNYLTRR